MKKVYLIHGFNASPNGSWLPWLMSELKKKDIYACALPMPYPENPQVDGWVKSIAFNLGVPSTDIFLVGHSLGVSAILRYLERLSPGAHIGGAILVSGPYENLKDEAHKILDPFFVNSFDFDHIKKACNKFVVIHAIDDEVVPINHAILLSNKLSCEVVTVDKGGHLGGHNGVRELPQALAELEKMIKE